MSIRENIKKIKAEMAQAAIAAGRDPKEITLCAATKMNDADAVRQAIAAGADCCGENKVQELVQKLAQDAYRGAPVHFIGHLQTNKVRQVVGNVELIQSVDRVGLLEAIQKEAAKQGIVQNILLQVNIAGEETKGGFTAEAVLQIMDKIENYSNVFVRGLMVIPPVCQNPGDNDKFFQEICNLAVDITAKKSDNVCVEVLSMGMSDDFTDAIRCGSTMIRLGTAIFGPRDYTK